MLGRRPCIRTLAILSLAALMFWLFVRSRYPTPEAALAAFYTGEHGQMTECEEASPLRSYGRRVVPLVIDALPDKTMPRRRYAIGFLGEGHYEEALPTLER